MGKVIILSDFTATENLGTVTIVGDTNIELTGISITTKPTSIVNSVQLSVTYAPTNATNKAVTWSSSNTSIATVSSTGLVTVLAAGTITISVISQANNLLTDSVTIACSLPNVEPTSVSILGSSSGIEGSEIQLSATVLPTNATNKAVTWSSSNTSIATVSSSGLVSLLSVGTVTIAATSQENNTITGTKDITVSTAVVTSKAIISVTRNVEGIDYATLTNGDTINVVFPNGTVGGTDITIKGIDGNTFCTLVHNKTNYPTIADYVWKDFGYFMNSPTGNDGAYPDLYFVRSAYQKSVLTPNRGLIAFNGLANGNYRIRIYPYNSNSAYNFASSYWPNICYAANNSGDVPITFSFLNNKTQYVEVNCTVEDGTLSIMAYVKTNISNAPQLSILEIEKI